MHARGAAHQVLHVLRIIGQEGPERSVPFDFSQLYTLAGSMFACAMSATIEAHTHRLEGRAVPQGLSNGKCMLFFEASVFVADKCTTQP